MLPAFSLGFDHFISPVLADDTFHHRFSDWFQSDSAIFKNRDAAGNNNGYYSPALAVDNIFEPRLKNSINSLHVKYSVLPHVMSASMQLRKDSQTLHAPALGTHWGVRPSKRLPPGPLPIHGFQPLTTMSCAHYRKFWFDSANRASAKQNLATAQVQWRQGLNHSPVAQKLIITLLFPFVFPSTISEYVHIYPPSSLSDQWCLAWIFDPRRSMAH